MTAQRSYIDTPTAQVTAPGLYEGFSFRGLKKLKGGDSWIHSTAQRKEHSKTDFGKRNLMIPGMSSKNRRLFTGAKLVLRPAWKADAQQTATANYENEIE